LESVTEWVETRDALVIWRLYAVDVPYSTRVVDGLLVIHEIVAVLVPPCAERELMDSGLLTVMVTVFDVAVFPAASRATAVRVWVPLVTPRVFQVPEYGAVVRVERRVPSTRSSTVDMPEVTVPEMTGSVAETAMVAEPERVEPLKGDVMEVTGAVVSGVWD
jgi:hypothetical protein